MQITFSNVKQRAFSFIKDNIFLSCLFLFIMIAGIMAGIHIVRSMQAFQIPDINALPDELHIAGVAWLSGALLALSVHCAIAAMLFLSGMWLPMAFLWPTSILLRGIYIGMYMGLCAAAWPSRAALLLLLVLLVDTAVLLPVMIALSHCAYKFFVTRCKQLTGQTLHTQSLSDYATRFLGYCAGLLPCVVLEGLIAPLVLYIFC